MDDDDAEAFTEPIDLQRRKGKDKNNDLLFNIRRFKQNMCLPSCHEIPVRATSYCQYVYTNLQLMSGVVQKGLVVDSTNASMEYLIKQLETTASLTGIRIARVRKLCFPTTRHQQHPLPQVRNATHAILGHSVTYPNSFASMGRSIRFHLCSEYKLATRYGFSRITYTL